MRTQRGGALLVMLMIASIAVAYLLVSTLTATRQKLERDEVTAKALAQAKEALIGWSASNNPANRFGVLPQPDLGNSRNNNIYPLEEGRSAAVFAGNTKNLTVIGRLPWRTLGIPPLRDAKGECLWYAISGTFKDILPANVLNWDSLGHFDLYTSNGSAAGTVSTAGTQYNARPIAVIFSPGELLPGQNRTASAVDTVTECGGNYDVRNYLDSYTANVNIGNIVNYLGGTNNATGYAYGLNAGSNLFTTPLPDAAIINPASTVKKIISGKTSVASSLITNDATLAMTTDDLFGVVGRHTGFAETINQMLYKLSSCLAPPAPTPFAPMAPSNKGVDYTHPFFNSCPGIDTAVRDNWRENLLYVKPASGKVTVNGDSNCDAVLIFSGSRTGTQNRALAAERLLASNYLEDIPATITAPARPNLSQYALPNPTFAGLSPTPSQYNTSQPSADVFRCLKPGMAVSFASNIGGFSPSGVGVSIDTMTDPANPTVNIANGGGTSGGCLWFATPVPLLKKTVRAYYAFQFGFADPIGGTDRGNGFTFSLLRSDLPLDLSPLPPIPCGNQIDMGALDNLSGWGGKSYLIETDVRRDAATADPVENHTAIMAYGNLVHSPTNGNPTTACNGSAAGCLHSPANKFEESPTPAKHNQRIEIHTGCDAACTVCDPPSHGGANSNVRISAWVNCTNCNDTGANLDRTVQPPVASRCIAPLDAELNSFYPGFTGGFRSGAAAQSVTISGFDLRSE